jgi:hypothetical protein
MFQQMLNASRAVLLRPSVSTFEEYERNDLGWATIYVAISAVVAALLNAIGFVLKRPYVEQQLRDLENQLNGQPLPPFFNSMMNMGGQSLVGSLVFGLLGTLIGFFFWLGIVYLLGRAFGGTGTFGELGYDMALFQAPIAVVNALISMIAIGPIAIVGSLATLALGLYSIYLTYVGIQAGMNLPGNKALLVILIPIIVLVVLCCLVSVLFGFAIANMLQPS